MAVSATPGSGRVAGPAFLALWALVALATATGWRPALDGALVAAVPLGIYALIVARPSQRLAIVAILTAAVALAWTSPGLAALRPGLDTGLLAAAFLGTNQMFKVAIEGTPRLAAERADLGGLDARALHDAIVLRTSLLASVLAAGAISAVAPLAQDATDTGRRLGFAQAALQGVAVAVLWSPFFVAMGICTRLVPGPSLPAVMAMGLGLAALALVITHFLQGNRRGGIAWRGLARPAAETAVLALAIAAANRYLGLGNLEAIVVGIPLVALTVGRRELMADPAGPALRWMAALESIAVEALLVMAALLLAQAIGVLAASGQLPAPPGLDQVPGFALVAVAPVTMVALALLGLHPIVSASAFLPLLSALGRLDDLVVIGSVLLGWMLCASLSVFVLPAMFAAALFRVPPRALVTGRMIAFCVPVFLVGVAYLDLLQALRGA